MAESAWNLAVELVQEGVRDDAIPSLARLGELGQVGDVPALITELARQLDQPDRHELAARVREHAHEREAVGFAPREIVAEFLLLRRVLARFVSAQGAGSDDAIDRLTADCVVAYFDRVTAELAYQARRSSSTTRRLRMSSSWSSSAHAATGTASRSSSSTSTTSSR
jgi:hypothetical protein